MRILLIEDDPSTAEFIIKGLSDQGHQLNHCDNGRDGLFQALEDTPDLLIVDRMLPQMDGIEVIRELRRSDCQLPVIILSALADVDNRVEGLQAGADDYLTKPFALAELSARVEAQARRQQTASATTEVTRLQLSDLELNLLTREVTRAGEPLDIKGRELKLLEFLLQNQGQVVTRNMLLEHVWDYHFDPQTNVIDVHISRLRAKIDKHFEPKLLHTIRGAGYTLKVAGT
ncbi:response regulator transcription factor [Marinobacterium jannaschii]|uniref:response regulator transcription factor n=1 Tax=Marinobacterium jannaschii TaxID=64970 RepID=UPI00048A223B|nr:response regulator transcription factor [Marinobacterium jannaschii]